MITAVIGYSSKMVMRLVVLAVPAVSRTGPTKTVAWLEARTVKVTVPLGTGAPAVPLTVAEKRVRARP